MSSGHEEPSIDKTCPSLERKSPTEHVVSSPNSQEREAKSLEDLPVELRSLIFEYCLPPCIQAVRHVQAIPQAGGNPPEEYPLATDAAVALAELLNTSTPYQPILSLCSTSKACRTIAQPILYRAVMAGGLDRLTKTYESLRLNPTLWKHVRYLSADLRNEEYKMELERELEDVLAGTDELRTLCLRLHPEDLELKGSNEPDDSDPSGSDATPGSLLLRILARLPPHTTVLHIVGEEIEPWLGALRTIISYFPRSCRVIWSRCPEQACPSYAVREQIGEGDSKPMSLELRNPIDGETRAFRTFSDVHGLNSPASLVIQTMDRQPTRDNICRLSSLVLMLGPGLRSLRLECFANPGDDPEVAWPYGFARVYHCFSWPLYRFNNNIRYSCLTTLTIYLELLVGGTWFKDRSGHTEIIVIGFFEPGGIRLFCPHLRELCIVEYFKYLNWWDQLCRQDIVNATSMLSMHNGRVAEFLVSLHAVWVEGIGDEAVDAVDQPDRTLLFKRFKFSPATWRIARNLGRVSVSSLLAHPGDVGFEPRDDGYRRVLMRNDVPLLAAANDQEDGPGSVMEAWDIIYDRMVDENDD